jgi:hypothetical protein
MRWRSLTGAKSQALANVCLARQLQRGLILKLVRIIALCEKAKRSSWKEAFLEWTLRILLSGTGARSDGGRRGGAHWSLRC